MRLCEYMNKCRSNFNKIFPQTKKISIFGIYIQYVGERKNLRSKKSKFFHNQNLVSIFETNDNGNTKMRPGSTIINKIKFVYSLVWGVSRVAKLNGLLPI